MKPTTSVQRALRRRLCVTGMLAALFTLGSAPLPAGADATIVVNSTADTAVASDGDCTLREAITNANTDSDTSGGDCLAGDGVDTIAFDIAGAGPHVIQPTTSFPALTQQVTIDGTTQAGTSPNTAAWPQPLTTQLNIVIDGSNAGAGTDGLAFAATADNSTLRGIAIGNFGDNNVDIRSGADGITIAGNFIGTDRTGTTPAPAGGPGAIMVAGSGGSIGGSTPADRNLVSGNAGSGIIVSGDDNSITGNYVGIAANGTDALANGVSGIYLLNAERNTVRSNLSAGNSQRGILLNGADCTANAIDGNYVGVDHTGSTTVANGGAGVQIIRGSSNTIGTVASNIIGGNRDGINITGVSVSTSNVVAQNFIGIAANSSNIANSGHGIYINAATDTMIGGPTGGNTIANNSKGVTIIADASTGNSVLGNSIFLNTLIGIDLSHDGLTNNDAGDSDNGPNELLNVPVFTSVSNDGTQTTADFTVDLPAGDYRIEFFSNPSSSDPAVLQQGQQFVDFLDITHAGSGEATFTKALSIAAPADLTATTTEVTGADSFASTSEFSASMAVKRLPIARPDSTTTVEGQSVSGTVLTNDEHPDGEPLTVSAVPAVQPSRGSVEITSDGMYTYTPAAGFVGSDAFTYEVCESTPLCTTATVTIEVTDLGSPVANDDEGTTSVEMPLTIRWQDNDTMVDSAILASFDSLSEHGGTITSNGNGTFRYTPALGFSGEDAFTYQICDNDDPATCDTATIDVVVAARVVLSGVVRSTSGEPEAGATIIVTAGDGSKLTTTTAPDGTYSVDISTISSGITTISATTSSGVLVEVPTNIDGESATRDFVIPAAGESSSTDRPASGALPVTGSQHSRLLLRLASVALAAGLGALGIARWRVKSPVDAPVT